MRKWKLLSTQCITMYIHSTHACVMHGVRLQSSHDRDSMNREVIFVIKGSHWSWQCSKTTITILVSNLWFVFCVVTTYFVPLPSFQRWLEWSPAYIPGGAGPSRAWPGLAAFSLLDELYEFYHLKLFVVLYCSLIFKVMDWLINMIVLESIQGFLNSELHF